MEQDRLVKLEKLRELGYNPYHNRFHPNVLALPSSTDGLPRLPDIQESDTRYRIAGRVTQINDMGGSKFIFIKRDNKISQIYVKKEVESAFKLAELLQLGDFIGACGPIFQTKNGRVALKVESLSFLTKALRGLGKTLQAGNEIHDKELLYRQRYIDMILNPETLETFKKRSEIIRSIRRFLEERDFIEVETRTLTPIHGGANARPFITHHNSLDQDLYLRIAPELDLKRLIVGGMDRIYEIGKNFRNEGIDKQHNPEFTSLELYQAYSTFNTMIVYIQELLFSLSNGAISEFDFITLEDVEKKYGPCWDLHLQKPTFVTRYLQKESPLARPNDVDSTYVDRFELFINGVEIANGFSELNDPQLQRANFEAQVVAKNGGNQEAMEMDEDYCRALEYGMPPTAGLGIGIDRLIMILLNKKTIKDVIPFPQYREGDWAKMKEASIKRQQAATPPSRAAPRYDEVFYQGKKWLDEL